MEIEYKNDDKIAFEFLMPNAVFIYNNNLYVKINEFSENIIGSVKSHNCIRLKDLMFDSFLDSTMVKPVKAKIVVEE